MSLHKLCLRAPLLFLALLALPHEVCPRQSARPAVGQTDAPVRVTILFLSNVAQATPIKRGSRGGLARVSTLYKLISKESPNTLILSGGDTIAPSAESITYKGAQMIDAWNQLGLDYSVFGSHDFDYGDEELLKRMGESKFKWLGANVVDSKTGKTFGGALPFVVRELQGVKIGILGIVLPETKVTSRPGPMTEFRSPCETARAFIPQMRAAGAQFIIALSHLSLAENKSLVRCAPQIELVLGGHDVVELESVVQGRPIITPEAKAASVVRVDLYLSPKAGDALQSMSWEWIPVTADLSDDPAMFAVIKRYTEGTGLDEVLGRTSEPLDARSAANRTGETNIGSFIADVFRNATGADVALINGGSIRADTVITPGELTKRDVVSILPFNNKVVVIEVPGEVLRQALEHGVSRTGSGAEPGRFPQVSGIRFYFDLTRPSGNRVVGITVNGRPLDPKKTYTLVTTGFIAGGGDQYEMFKDRPVVQTQEMGDTDLLSNAIRDKIIIPRADGRIGRLDFGAVEK
jgi:5'-nucleotidase